MMVAILTVLSLICLEIGEGDTASAHEDTYTLAHRDIFGDLRRGPVVFLHRAHEEALDVEGCGICHHVPDEKTGDLVYAEDEEMACKECHGPRERGTVSGLREAYHRSCTLCHRSLQKAGRKKSGPTTCGECHRPELPLSDVRSDLQKNSRS